MSNLATKPAGPHQRNPEAARLRHRAATRGGSSPLRASRRWPQDALRRRLLAIADFSAGATAAVAVALPATGSLWPLAAVPLWLVVAKLLGLYDRDHQSLRHLTADEIPSIAAWAIGITVLLELGLPLASSVPLGSTAAILHALVAGLAATGARAMARWAWWRWTPPELLGILGEDPTLDQLRRKFGLFGAMHFELTVEGRLEDLGTGESRDLELRRLAGEVDRIVVAADGVEADLIAELSSICREQQVKLSVVSPLRGRALPSPHLTNLADLPVLEYNTWDPSRSSLLLKRAFDLLVASAALALVTPLLLLIVIAIKLDTRGPAMFSQLRAGLGGRPFRMYKLRTMDASAEAQLDRYVDLDGLDDPMFKLAEDPRVTRVGRILRRLSLDELPQLINVLVGEMSLVGPRPEQVELVERYEPEDRIRLAVKPGITGPMQVSGRGELLFAERMAVELEYVENQSLSRDLRIIFQTLPAVVRGTGAF